MRFTDAQFYYMRRLAHGVSKTEFWKWRQVPLRGLFMRGMFKFVMGEHYAIVTTKGWNALQNCLTPQYRQDASRPVFQHEGRQHLKKQA